MLSEHEPTSCLSWKWSTHWVLYKSDTKRTDEQTDNNIYTVMTHKKNITMILVTCISTVFCIIWVMKTIRALLHTLTPVTYIRFLASCTIAPAKARIAVRDIACCWYKNEWWEMILFILFLLLKIKPISVRRHVYIPTYRRTSHLKLQTSIIRIDTIYM